MHGGPACKRGSGPGAKQGSAGSRPPADATGATARDSRSTRIWTSGTESPKVTATDGPTRVQEPIVIRELRAKLIADRVIKTNARERKVRASKIACSGQRAETNAIGEIHRKCNVVRASDATRPLVRETGRQAVASETATIPQARTRVSRNATHRLSGISGTRHKVREGEIPN
jgi:hypothetical protein